MIKKIIFLDLDGIIRDFVQGVIDKFDLKITHNDVNRWDYFEEELDIPDFWERLDYDFWLQLPKTPFADKILNILELYNPVILTSPTYTSAGGTQAWIRENLPDYFNEKRYLIGPAKWACGNIDSILIDDSDSNVSKFLEAGGKAILFPAPWNAKKEIAFNISHFETMLSYYIKENENG